MGQVLYEVHFSFDLVMFIPVIMLGFISFFPKIHDKALEQTGKRLTESEKRFRQLFCIFAWVFIFFITLIAVVGQLGMYRKVMGAYKSGQYKTVEGYVENFHPMPYAGHTHESFEINGVYFEYSDYSIITGYHNARFHGGVIYGNGQYLKIGYVPYGSNYGNIIVYIERMEIP